MFFSKEKRELQRLKAFQSLFLDENGALKPEAQVVLAFLRDETGSRGELGSNGIPYFYDSHNRFDANAAAFLLGKRRVFDLIIKYISLDERAVFALTQKRGDAEDEELKTQIDI